MRDSELQPAARCRLLVFAGTFAAALTLARLFVLLQAHVAITAPYLIGLLFSFSLAGLNGALLGLLLARCRGQRVATSLLWAVIALVVSAYIICFHYEAVFGRLPGVQLLFYWDQLSELSSSLLSNVPAGRVALELAAVVLALALAWHKLKDVRPLPIANRLMWLPGVMIVVAIGVNAVPGTLPDSMRWSSRDPLIWLAQSGFIKESYDLRKLVLSQQDFDRFLRLHGQADPGPVLDHDFPLCRPRPEPELAATGQSVIVLILESVGYREMNEDFHGKIGRAHV